MADTQQLGRISQAVGVLTERVANGQAETNRRLEKIEGKIDAQSNVPVAVFEEFKKEIKEDFVTKDQLSPVTSDVAFVKKILYSFIGLIVTAVVTALLRGVIPL